MKKRWLAIIMATMMAIGSTVTTVFPVFAEENIPAKAIEQTEALVSASTTVSMYRIYNPNSSEHFYTSSAVEKNSLVSLGWKDEGIGWTAPSKSKTPVYRLYNPNAGDHHYTINAGERDCLIKAGWKDEGIGWYSDDSKKIPVYRQYNPNAKKAGTHNYTTNKAENDSLVKAGWCAEGIGWYGTEKNTATTSVNNTAEIYRNDQFKFQFTLPKNWIFSSENTIKRMTEGISKGTAKEANAKADMGAYSLDQRQIVTIYESTAQNDEIKKYGSMEGVLNHATNQYKDEIGRKNSNGVLKKVEVAEIPFAGRSVKSVKMTCDDNGKPTYQMQIFFADGRRVVMITITCEENDTRQDVLNAFSAF